MLSSFVLFPVPYGGALILDGWVPDRLFRCRPATFLLKEQFNTQFHSNALTIKPEGGVQVSETRQKV
jgi:hypothetical protein